MSNTILTKTIKLLENFFDNKIVTKYKIIADMQKIIKLNINFFSFFYSNLSKIISTTHCKVISMDIFNNRNLFIEFIVDDKAKYTNPSIITLDKKNL